MKDSLVSMRPFVLAFLGVVFLLGARGFSDDPFQHRTRQMQFGVSGGNVNDTTGNFCCSGTLGSLVTDGTTLYILSNNHVLAREDRAAAGEEISQPGTIDNNCQPGDVVGHLSRSVPLTSAIVDAAIAEL